MNALLRFFMLILSAMLYILLLPAIYFSPTPGEWLNLISLTLFALGVPITLIIYGKNKKVPWYVIAMEIVIILIFLSIPPSNDREWARDVERIPIIKFHKNKDSVLIKNIRSFKYKTANFFEPNYIDAEYNLNTLNSAYYILSYWNGNKAIAHSMLSFGFADGRYLCVSVETRREKNEPQTGLRGLYNQYELIYIFAEEKDTLLLRSNFRDEEVYLFPLKPKKQENIKKVFRELLSRAHKLEKTPEFYNTLKENCFLSLFKDIKKVTGEPSGLDYRLILNGFSDKMGFERGWFKTNGLTFEVFKDLHHINKYIENDSNPAKNFSKKIRNKSQ